MWAGGSRSHPEDMSEQPPAKQVEVCFVGPPPTRRVECTQGVSDVEVDGSTLHCLVRGSFQPLLDAVRGYEVIDLSAVALDHERNAIHPRITP